MGSLLGNPIDSLFLRLSSVVPSLDIDCQLGHETLSSVTCLSVCIERISETLGLAYSFIAWQFVVEQRGE